MSDYERHSGTIERVYFDGDLESFADSIGLIELPKYYDSWEEYFMNEVNDYQVHNGKIYKINDTKYEDSFDVFDYKIEDNKIKYDLCFYNGGTCLYENIDRILDKVGNLDLIQEDDLEFKDDIDSVSYSDDFWYALTNGYIELDEILVDNSAKDKLKEAISIIEDFQYQLESSDFFEEM